LRARHQRETQTPPASGSQRFPSGRTPLGSANRRSSREPAVLTSLTVIGPGAAQVARAIDPDATVAGEAAATPYLVARHAGATLDPEELAASAGDTAALEGPLLAPVTPRASLRDVAVRLGAPVVVAEPATPGATGRARATAEAARGAGLAVAAFVLTGWPDPPGRTLLDERALLFEVTDVPVMTLEDGERPGWPVEDWRATEADVAASPVHLALEPYRAWEGTAPGDPRATPRPQIMETLLEIVAAEGPMLASRAYGLYNKASGGKKLTTVAKAPLSSAAYWLAQQGRLVLVCADDAPWQGEDVLRLPDTPPVVVRELGPRELVEVPLDEVAEVMRRLGPVPDRRRAVLDAYGLKRMTARAEEYLGLAEGLLER